MHFLMIRFRCILWSAEFLFTESDFPSSEKQQRAAQSRWISAGHPLPRFEAARSTSSTLDLDGIVVIGAAGGQDEHRWERPPLLPSLPSG